MSTRNREKRRLNAEYREAEREYQLVRAKRRRWIIGIGGLLLAAAVAFYFIAKPFDDDDDSVSASEGKKCVPVADELPEGAPEVDVATEAPTSLVIRDLVPGTGEEVPAGAAITADYIGVACTTGKIFDSSYSRGEPAQFTLAQVIQGWQEGIPGMKVGGRRLLGIPAEMAYGATGSPPDIGADEPLWFVVDIKSINSVPDASATAPVAPEQTTVAPTETTPAPAETTVAP